MKIAATFVTSAAGAAGFPDDGLPEIALVGRSNVGKSSLINALVRQAVARTSSTPGKTRLANIYRVTCGTIGPLYLVDLPGYGYARGGAGSAREFQELTAAYFRQAGRDGLEGRDGQEGISYPALPAHPAHPAPRSAALLLVDARHPGLQKDIEAWNWLQALVEGHVAIVATKTDKLARGERIRALRQFESVFEHPVLPFSAATGEGMEELWKLIDKLATNLNLRSRPPRPRKPAMAALRPRKNSSASTSRR